MKIKTKRFIIQGLLILCIIVVSNLLVRYTLISKFSVFDASSLFTYFGVLIGFAITIYTFGLSLVSDIHRKIYACDKIDSAKKDNLYNGLVSGFDQIKGDIWIIFYSIIVVVFFAIAKEISNPYFPNVEEWKIPETANISLFVTTTFSMWDIIKSLFNVSEINMELNKLS